MTRQDSSAIDVFFSYSHKDEKLRDGLAEHLQFLEQHGKIRAWHDRRILAGDAWADRLDERLERSALILLLVSSSFIASKFCWEVELRRALKRHAAGDARVVPIILRPCHWQTTPFGKLQALPKDARPITSWRDPHEAFLDVARGLLRLIDGMVAEREKRSATETLKPPKPKPRPQPQGIARNSEPPRLVTASSEERVNEKDGSVLVYVPGGTYTLGANDCGIDTQPDHTVVLSPYWIGKVPVTNARYERFLKAHPAQRKSLFWNDERFNAPNQPVVGVSWQDALAYCRWAGLDLPTEAQWETAARGADRRRYPWGNDKPTSQLAKFGEGWDKGSPVAVGSYPKGTGPYGTLDQAGNVWEWCRDLWRKNDYHDRGKSEPVVPGREDNESVFRVVRGGSWRDASLYLCAAIRVRNPVWDRIRYLGFRVVLESAPEHGS